MLVATDIAARGIDVTGISHVINYELPDEAESYVHRIGRTARNGADGVAITLCAPDERNKLHAVEKLTRTRLGPDDGHGQGRRSHGHRTGGPVAAAHGAPAPGDGAKPKRRRRRRQERRRAA